MSKAQILTAAQMRDAEQALFDTGTGVFDLMKTAAAGAAEWVRRIAAGRGVTVLCGPGNNGGDGYVIAHYLRAAGNKVQLIAPLAPKTKAAQQACALWGDTVKTSGGGGIGASGSAGAAGSVLVDCLFGSGLSRALSAEHALLLRDLAVHHDRVIAIDVPSGIQSDTGALLNEKLPKCDVTLALGAWKYAHWSLPGRAWMGECRLIPIGVGAVKGAAQLLGKPHIPAPGIDTHKYRRGLAAIVGGAMPGAAILSAEAAMRGGAGYVKLMPENSGLAADPGLVIDHVPGAADLAKGLGDARINAVLVGPGLGKASSRVAEAQQRLTKVLLAGHPCVLDADALHLVKPAMCPDDLPVLATPHDGELAAMCRNFSIIAETRKDRAATLAKVSNMVILAKGPDTVIASPDGRMAIARGAPSWLSVAGSGDVLAGIAVSRLAGHGDPFAAACEAVWLHSEAARLCGAAFTPLDLALRVSDAIGRCS